jgi:hypothetical protein
MTKHLPTETSNVKELVTFSNIKLIVVDLDGSLIEHGNNKAWNTIVKYREKLRKQYQVNLTIATGRTLTGAYSLINSLSLPNGMPLILYNGGLMVYHNTFEIIYNDLFKDGILKSVIDIALEYKTFILAYMVKGPSFLMGNQDYEYIYGWSNAGRPTQDFNKIKIEWQNKKSNISNLKPSAILVDTSGDPCKEVEIEKKISKIKNLSITKSGTSHYLEIRPQFSNKGRAIKRLAKELGITLEEIVALGDNDNDAEMLSISGIGVAVAGASKKAIKCADYIGKYDSSSCAMQLFRLIYESKRLIKT